MKILQNKSEKAREFARALSAAAEAAGGKAAFGHAKHADDDTFRVSFTGCPVPAAAQAATVAQEERGVIVVKTPATETSQAKPKKKETHGESNFGKAESPAPGAETNPDGLADGAAGNNLFP